MTALELQDALMEEVEKTLKDVITEKESEEEISGVKIFSQQLPVITSDEEDVSQFFPYAVIRMLEGQTQEEEPWRVTAGIHLGVYDPGEENQGHRHVMVMIQRIIDRFVSDPLLDNRYRAQQEIQWELDTDLENHPYFFGVVWIAFSVPKIGKRLPIYD